MNPLRYFCPATSPDGRLCAAAPGIPCRWDGWKFAIPHPEFHAERYESAAMDNEGAKGEPPGKEAFEALVLADSELF